MDHYQPDLLYTDGGVPFGNEIGRSLIAHLYNANAARNGGRPEVVYTCKQESNGMWVQDVERGVLQGHQPAPLADGHLDRRLVLQPRVEVPAGEAGSSTCSSTSSARTATC